MTLSLLIWACRQYTNHRHTAHTPRQHAKNILTPTHSLKKEKAEESQSEKLLKGERLYMGAVQGDNVGIHGALMSQKVKNNVGKWDELT